MANIVRLNPDQPNSFIAENEISISRLSSILDAAIIDYIIDDEGDIYASDGLNFPVWVSIEADTKLLCFYTYADVDKRHAEALVNKINGALTLVQFCIRNERLYGHFWMTYDGGADIKHIVKMLRRFAGAFREGWSRYKEAAVKTPDYWN